MKRLIIELDDDTHRQIKLDALNSDKTMKQYVLELIVENFKKKERGNNAQQK